MLRVLMSLTLLSSAALAQPLPAPEGYEWSAPGHPRTGNDYVWEVKCSNLTKQPINGVCIVRRNTSGAALQNIGVNPENNQWECAWTRPVKEATVRALCLK